MVWLSDLRRNDPGPLVIDLIMMEERNYLQEYGKMACWFCATIALLVIFGGLGFILAILIYLKQNGAL